MRYLQQCHVSSREAGVRRPSGHMYHHNSILHMVRCGSFPPVLNCSTLLYCGTTRSGKATHSRLQNSAKYFLCLILHSDTDEWDNLKLREHSIGKKIRNNDNLQGGCLDQTRLGWQIGCWSMAFGKLHLGHVPASPRTNVIIIGMFEKDLERDCQ